MSIQLTAASTAPARTRADVIAVPVFADRVLGPGADAVDEATGGILGSFMERAGFTGGRGETLLVPLSGPAGMALLVGLGAADAVTVDDLRSAAATVALRAKDSAKVATTLVDAAPAGTDRAGVAQAVTEGVLLGSYSFDDYRSKPKTHKLRSVVLLGTGPAALKRGIERGRTVAEAVMWTRDMVNTPARARARPLRQGGPAAAARAAT